MTRVIPANVEKELASDALESSPGKLYHVPLIHIFSNYSSKAEVQLTMKYQ